ncbi:MAG: hypothetical protein OXL41_15500 [Nitrospinae bacterium]|nr:hypothetical protein [Nitrospinota bacterium]
MKRNANSTRFETPERTSFLRQNLTRFASVFLGLSFLLVFSTDVFGIVSCTGVNTDISEASNRRYIAEAPNDPVRYYVVGLSKYCKGKISEGINYMEKASDMGEITASYALGLYYGSDKTGDVSKMVPEIQENYDAALFFYERTANLIESTPHYPQGVHVDLPGVEGNVFMSVRTFLSLSQLYYTGYSRALGDMLEKNVSYTDTIKVITNIQTSAERCLRRPSLSVWKGRQSEITHSRRVICGAYKAFAEKAFVLETRRKEVALQCENSLKDCAAHKAVFGEIVKEAQKLSKATFSVPPI